MMIRSDDDRMAEHAERRTNIDAQLLEAWRAAAKDPNDQVSVWLKFGAPTGITSQLQDPGIFP